MLAPSKKQLKELKVKDSYPIVLSKRHNNNEIRRHKITLT